MLVLIFTSFIELAPNAMRHEGLKWETGLVFVVVVMICAAVESKEALCRERCSKVSKGKHSRVLQLTRTVEAKVYFI